VAIPTIEFPFLILTKKRGVFQVRGADLALGNESKAPALCAGVAPRCLKLGAVILPMSAQVVSVLDLVKHRSVMALVNPLRTVVNQYIGRIGTVDAYGILVGNGDGLVLKGSDGGVKSEEYIEISLQRRLKRNGPMALEVDDLTRKATRVLRNLSNRHRVKLVLKICECVS
jgi:hypothetical protein